MSDIPSDLLYSEDHEYMKETPEEGVFQIGITDFAQGELGDIVFVDLPDPGTAFDQQETFGTIEAVKAVSDLYCPVAGEVVEVNDGLDEDPSVVNVDPYGEGWMIKLKIADAADLDDLMDAEAYAEQVG